MLRKAKSYEKQAFEKVWQFYSIYSNQLLRSITPKPFSLFSKVQGVQECDASKVDSSTISWLPKIKPCIWQYFYMNEALPIDDIIG
jgi:hypothetical protein